MNSETTGHFPQRLCGIPIPVALVHVKFVLKLKKKSICGLTKADNTIS
jgi:hypothetical protein